MCLGLFGSALGALSVEGGLGFRGCQGVGGLLLSRGVKGFELTCLRIELSDAALDPKP